MESELMYGDKGTVPEEEYLIPIGQSNIVHEGNDVTLVSFGKMMKVAEETYIEAKKENISVELIDFIADSFFLTAPEIDSSLSSA